MGMPEKESEKVTCGATLRIETAAGTSMFTCTLGRWHKSIHRAETAVTPVCWTQL